jgi:acyl dehydratase
MSIEAADLRFDDLSIDRRAEAEYEITPELHELFVSRFADRSPIHVDEAEARARGFLGRVMHGAILHGFLSELVGMRLPGRRALLLSTELSYLGPSYLHDRLRLEARVAQRVEAMQTVVLHVRFFNLTRDALVAKGRVQVRVQ